MQCCIHHTHLETLLYCKYLRILLIGLVAKLTGISAADRSEGTGRNLIQIIKLSLLLLHENVKSNTKVAI